MSTDLYGVRITGVDRPKRTFSCTVFVVYYDVAYKNHQPLLDDASFFARILKDGRVGMADSAIDDPRMYDEAFVDSNAWRYIESVKRLATRNEPVTDWSRYSDFYYERDGTWQDETLLVQGDFLVTVTDPKWIAHFKKGETWGTTSYPTHADQPGAFASALPDLRREARRITAFAIDEKKREAGTPEDAFFSDDETLLAITSQYSGLVVYDTATWTEKMRVDGDAMFPHAEFFPNSHFIGMRDFHDKVTGWDADTGAPANVELPRGRVRSKSGLLRGNYGETKGLDLLDEHGTLLRVIAPERSSVEAVSFSPDEETVAIAGMSNVLSIHRCADGEKLREFELDVERINHVSFSRDGRWIAVSGKLIAIIDAQTGATLRRSATLDYWCEVAWATRYIAVVQITHPNGYDGHVSIYELGGSWDGSETIVMAAPAAPPPRKKKKKPAPVKKKTKKKPAAAKKKKPTPRKR